MSQHITSRKVYLLIFISLIVLTFMTVKVAFIDLGWLNTFIAITIAVCKALLVILYFMHMRYSSRLIWLFVAVGVFWLLLLIGLTMSDFISRDWLEARNPTEQISEITSFQERL